MTTTEPIPPKRGGIHPTYGKFIGGARLNDAYEIVEGDNSLYRFFTQRRHEKTITSIERALRESRDTTTAVKFNGTLEPTVGNSYEMGKEWFVNILKRRDSDNKVVHLFENARCFELEAVVGEFNLCLKISDLHE